MNINYRTLHKDIGLIQRSNEGWDLWFDNGDTVRAEDFHSLQVGIIIACLTSWNYMNRYGNPTYEVFGNRAYELLKANKSSMVAYKIQQYFMECLKRMRRVYEVVSLVVSEIPSRPYAYFVEFEVISINNQLVDGSFTITIDESKSTSYFQSAVYMPYASNITPLQIDLFLKNEYGGGLEGEIVYMYLKKGDGDYEFIGIIGKTDEKGYLGVEYTPTETIDSNVLFFEFHGNSTYNPCSSERIAFQSEIKPTTANERVRIVWDDMDNYRNTRPSSVEFGLYCDGHIVGTAVLNNENDWENYIFVQLYDSDNRYLAYEYQDTNVNNYVLLSKTKEGHDTVYTFQYRPPRPTPPQIPPL